MPGVDRGLTAVEAIVDAHGGAVLAEGHPGGGATFRIEPAVAGE